MSELATAAGQLIGRVDIVGVVVVVVMVLRNQNNLRFILMAARARLEVDEFWLFVFFRLTACLRVCQFVRVSLFLFLRQSHDEQIN